MKRFKTRIAIDPPKGVVLDEDHDFVFLEVESTNLECVTWLMKRLNDVIASHDGIFETEED